MARTRPHSSEAFPAPVAPAIRTWVPCNRTSQGSAVLAAADRQRLEVGVDRDREGGDEGGQGVAADELQHHPPGPGGADPAQQGAEPVRQGLRVLGESAADWPETSRTATRSVYRVAVTLPSTGRMMRP